MDSGARSCIAFIAAKLISGRAGSYVFDYAESRYKSMGGIVEKDHINLFDYDRSCYVSGSSAQLFDYGTASHIQLKISGQAFSGYDYKSSAHFSGSVSGGAISFYDYGQSQYFNYKV